MARDSVLIIANPTADRGRGARTAEAVAARLRHRGVNVTVRHTTARGEAEAIAAEAVSLSRRLPQRKTGHAVTTANPKRRAEDEPARDRQDRPWCVVACGGDGTVQEVANALAKLRPGEPRASAHEELPSNGVEPYPVMGIAPAGRCNDFARALGVPTDPEGIAEVLATGTPRAIDLGRANDRYFCTVATVGVDAEVSSFVDTMRMPLSGTIAYLYGALRVLARYQPRRLRIDGDFGLIEQPVFLASSANTCVYGGAIPIAPGASPTDGMLDLCLIDAVSRLRSLTLLPTVLRGRHRSCAEVRFLQTKRLRIDASDPLELWADGERIARTPVTIEVAPGAIHVVLPRPGGDTPWYLPGITGQ